MELSPRDLKRLEGVHPDLVKVITLAATMSHELFVVTEGVRTEARQMELFRAGKSKTLRSRHLPGHAVDLAVWIDRDQDKVVDVDEISWKFSLYKGLSSIVKRAADKLEIPITWGGDWKSIVDGPHFELPRTEYPQD